MSTVLSNSLLPETRPPNLHKTNRGLAVGVGGSDTERAEPTRLLSGRVDALTPAAREHLSGTSIYIYHLPLGTRTGKFPFSVFGVRNRNHHALALLSPSGPFTKRVAEWAGKARAASGGVGIPRAPAHPAPRLRVPAGFGGVARPSGVGGQTAAAGVSGLHERRWLCDLFPIQAQFAGLTDARLLGCRGLRRAVQGPALTLRGRGGNPETIYTGVYCKSNRKSLLQREGQ